MSEQVDTAQQSPSRKNNVFRNVMRSFLYHVRHNWVSKLVCLLLAVLLWGFVISQNTSLTRTKVFTGVQLSASKSAVTTLRQNGFIITSGLENLPSIRFTAEVPQKYYDTVSENTYSLRLDLTRITQSGWQQVPVVYTNSTVYGNVTSISLSTVDVFVEEYVTRTRIPVSVQYTGTLPDGMYADIPKADPGIVSVAGPRSKVMDITRCVAMMDLNSISAAPVTLLSAVDFQLYDAAGNVISMDNITVTVSGQTTAIDSIVVEQNVWPQFTLSVSQNGIVRGKPADGFDVKSIKLSDTELTVALETASCDQDAVYLTSAVDLTGATATFTRGVTVAKPTGCKHISKEIVYITVEIGPVMPEGGV